MNEKNVPQDILFALSEKFPEIYFGGSVALNILGFLNRPINDIDIYVPSEQSEGIVKHMNKKKFGIFKHLWEKPKNEHLKINFRNYFNFCIFLTEYTNRYRYNLNGKDIYLSNIEDIISAKRHYLNNSIGFSGEIKDKDGYNKHETDLREIEKKIKTLGKKKENIYDRR